MSTQYCEMNGPFSNVGYEHWPSWVKLDRGSYSSQIDDRNEWLWKLI